MTENNSLEEGGKSCLTLAGLGKLSPNMLLIGFKSNWKSDLDSANQYFNILEVKLDLEKRVLLINFCQSAFDQAFSVGILRVRSGLDFSLHIQPVQPENERGE